VILRLIEPGSIGLEVKQVSLDECEDEVCARLREGGKYADELVILPSGEVVVVECARWPTAYDAMQALETLRRLVRAGRKVVAVVVAGGEGFDKRDKSLIAGALSSECSKYRVEPYLLRSGQRLHLRDMSAKFAVMC